MLTRAARHLNDSQFTENQKGTRIVDALDHAVILTAAPKILADVAAALPRAVRRNAFVAINLVGSIVQAPDEWPRPLRVGFAVEAATEPVPFQDDKGTRQAMRLALGDADVAAAIRDALPDVSDRYVGYKAGEVIESIGEHLADAANADARSIVLEILERLRDEPDLVLSPGEHRDKYPDFMRDVAEPDRQERLRDGWADALINELVAAAEPAKTYVDKHVAHLDRVESPATYADLHRALDAIVEALLTVKFALTGSAPTVDSFNRAAEQFDWARVFRTAWITDTTWPKVMST